MSNRTTKGTGKKGIASFLALLSFTSYMPVSCLPAFADISATALPDLNKAVNGDVSTSGNRMDVAVKGGTGTVGQFDWNTFNVGKDAQVNWVFNANSQTALNRVLASGGMSYIYGKLTESSGSGCPSCVNTSKVILINPSGILFGNGSSVNLNSFTASTFDIKGAKNLKDLSPEELKTYAGTITSSSGENGTLFDIAGYNKTVSFVANDNMVDGNGYITSNGAGTRLASVVMDGTTMDVNKTIAVVGNKVDINNSNLTTTYSSTPNAQNETQTRSNIKLVTGDGVNFYYTAAGNVNNSVTVSKSTKTTNQKYGIDINNSELRTGNLLAYNGVTGDKSAVNIKDSTIYTKKLLGTDVGSYKAEQTGTDGNINITSYGKVNIEDSNIQTTNDRKDGVNISTGIAYGNMTIQAKDDITVKNTQLRTADSLKNTSANNITAGNINIKSTSGNVNLIQDAPTDSDLYTNTAVASAGNLTIDAAKDVNITGYNKIQAKGHGTANNASAFQDRTININANNVNLDSTKVTAKNANVNADAQINVLNTKFVADNTGLYGADTTIDNSSLQYNNLAFYNSDKKNNVTIKNDSLFDDKDDSSLTLTTNGNLTLDNATLHKTASSNQNAVNLESTLGNVNVKNGSQVVTSNGGFTAKASNGAIAVNDSTIYAKNGSVELTAKNNVVSDNSTIWAKDGNMNLTSSAGKVVATDSNISAEGGDTTISQALSMNIDEDFLNSTIGATNKLTLTSDADITGGTLQAGTGYINDYKDLVSLNNEDLNIHFIFSGALMDAGNDISITDLASANKVDFVAGNNIDLASTVGMDLTDVSVNAGNTTNIAAAAKLTTDGLDILGGTKTTLSGSTVKTKGDSVIATNGNKLAVNADGAVDIAVTGVTNANNGLEINADVNTSKGSDPLAGKTVKVNAKDGTLAISKIKADTLDLTADTILAGKTTISADKDNVGSLAANGVNMDSKGYIEIKTDGGFNLDATTDYNSGNKGIYTGGNYGTTTTVGDKVAVGDRYQQVTEKDLGTVTNSELISSETTTGNEIGRTQVSKEQVSQTTSDPVRTDNVTQDGKEGYTLTTKTETTYEVTDNVTYETTTNNVYKDTATTTTEVTTNTYQNYEQTTTSRDTQHVATLNDNEQNGFVLVYGKTSQETQQLAPELVDTNKVINENTVVTNEARTETLTGTTTGTSTYTITEETSNTTFCEYEPIIEPDINGDIDLGGYDVASVVKNPRHSEGISNAAPIQNDLADTTSTVVAAAARLEIADDDSDDDLLD